MNNTLELEKIDLHIELENHYLVGKSKECFDMYQFEYTQSFILVDTTNKLVYLGGAWNTLLIGYYE